MPPTDREIHEPRGLRASPEPRREKARRRGLRHRAATLASLSLLLCGCSMKPVKVGAVLPLTGPWAAYGGSVREGILLAEDEVNRGGGIQGRRLEIVIRDSCSQPRTAAEEFQRLVKDERVPAVVGGTTSSEALAMAAMAGRFQRLLFSPSASSPRLGAAGDWVFRNWPSDEIEGQALADFAAYSLHATRILMVVERGPYAEGIGEVFARRFESGDRKALRVEFEPGEGRGDSCAQRVALAARGAQVLFLAGYGEDILPLAGRLKAAGLDLPMIASSALAGSSLLRKRPSEAEGLIFARPAFDPASTDAAVQAFVTGFKARFGHEPDTFAAHAYDAVRILANVMASEGSRASDIRRGLVAVRNYEGVAGTTSFDANGGPIQTIQICTALKGRVVPLRDVLDEVLQPLQKRVEEIRFGK
jgi:branched-chain amino acid transport system substrate-binding protein